MTSTIQRMRLPAALTFLLALCAAAYAQAPQKRVAIFLGPTQDKYLGSIGKGFTDAAQAGGMAVTVFSSPFDPALQAQQIDEAIGRKFDMLVVQPISQKAVVPPLTRAKGAGIPVVLVVVPLEDSAAKDLFVTYAGYDDTMLGKLAGEAMADQLMASGRDKATVAIIAGSMDEGKAPLRQKAFVEAVRKHPNIEVVATEDVKWNPVVAERAAGQLLARFASRGIDGIYGMNDTLANASIEAATAAGLKPGTGKGQIVVVGGNCQAVGVENLRKGTMAATVLDLPAQEGALAAQKAAAFFKGENLEKHYYIEPQRLTAANIASFATACSY